MGTEIELELNNVEKRILQSIKKLEKPISKTQLAKKLKLSPATVSRYVDMLVLKRKVKIQKYNNIHLVFMGGNDIG